MSQEAAQLVLTLTNRIAGNAVRSVSPSDLFGLDLKMNEAAFQKLVTELEKELRVPLLDAVFTETLTVRQLQQIAQKAAGKFRPPTSWEVFH